MEIKRDDDGRVAVSAATYGLSIDPSGPWLQISWSGGTIRLGAGAGDGAAAWSALRSGDRGSPQVSLACADGRKVIFDFREDLFFSWAELPAVEHEAVLLAGPGLPNFTDLFSPEPTALRRSNFAPDDHAITSISSDLAYHRGHWLFSPPPFCFALGVSEAGRVAIGVSDRESMLQFTSFEYDHGAFVFKYDHPVQGRYTSPRLVFLPTVGDGYRAVQAYCDHLRTEGLAPIGTARNQASWWQEPVFCGWGEQSYRRVRDSRYPTLGVEPRKADRYYLPDGIPSNSTRELYEECLLRLEAEGIDPGIITIDDKWQIAYGLGRPDESRWPDLEAFISRQHDLGRHVLLWWKLWDGEGLPADELLAGGPYAIVDPTSPPYRQRLYAEMEYALGRLGGDGLKIDILHRGPTRSHSRSREGLAGARLQLEMMRLLKDAAIAAKLDALLVAHSANPYFADVADVVRLNDVSTIPGTRSFLNDMLHRARIARAACPQALIDSDNWPCPDRTQWREYVNAQPEIGIPALYYATGIDLSNEPLQPEDYVLVRESWKRWRERIQREGGGGTESTDERRLAQRMGAE